MEKWVTAPTNVYELVLGYPWPIGWAYFALALAVLASFAIGWQIKFPRWLLGLLLAWFGWQVVSAMQAVDLTLAIPTVKHFGACVACFCHRGFWVATNRAVADFLAGPASPVFHRSGGWVGTALWWIGTVAPLFFHVCLPANDRGAPGIPEEDLE